MSNLSEEEQNAIENLKKDFIIMNNGEIYESDDYILYNLISKQQKELDKKDKVIDLMAEHIFKNSNNLAEYFCNGIPENICEARGNTEEGCRYCIKLYFYKKVEE